MRGCLRVSSGNPRGGFQKVIPGPLIVIPDPDREPIPRFQAVIPALDPESTLHNFLLIRAECV
jgi:hypothetical protein